MSRIHHPHHRIFEQLVSPDRGNAVQIPRRVSSRAGNAALRLERAVTSSRKAFRRWSWVHKWSSLICTLFMLMLCITGLPLIFHEEIDELLHEQVNAAEVPPGTPKADLDRVVANGIAREPGQVVHFLIWDPARRELAAAERRQVAGRRSVDQPFCARRRAYRGVSRCARRHRTLHLHHVQAARRHVCRPARKAVPRPDGNPVLRRDRLGHRRLRAVDAQARLRHLSPRPQPRGALARRA